MKSVQCGKERGEGEAAGSFFACEGPHCLQLFGELRPNLGQNRCARAVIAATVQFGIVQIDALIVVGRRSCGCRAGRAGRHTQAGPGGDLRAIEGPVKGHIIVNTGRSRRAAGHQRHKSRAESDGFDEDVAT